MFRRIISIALLYVFTLSGTDVFAAEGYRTSPRRMTERQKRAAYLSAEARSSRNVAAKMAAVKAARRDGLSERRQKAAQKAQLTRAGVVGDDSKAMFDRIAALDAQQAVFTPVDFIDLVGNPATVGDLVKGLNQALLVIDSVLANRHWKHFAPVAPIFDRLKLSLNQLQTTVSQRISQGSLTVAQPVEVFVQPVEVEHEEAEAFDFHDEPFVRNDREEEDGVGLQQTTTGGFLLIEDVRSDARGTDELNLIRAVAVPLAETKTKSTQTLLLEDVKYEAPAATPWLSRGTKVALAGSVVCFVIAGVAYPVLFPTLAINAGISAGVSTCCAAGVSLWKQENLKDTAQRMARAAVHGAFAGSFGGVVCSAVPSDVLGGAILERTIEGLITGTVVGGVSGIDDNKILQRALTCGATGAALGGILGSAKELYSYIRSLQATADVSQRQAEMLKQALEDAKLQRLADKDQIELLLTQRSDDAANIKWLEMVVSRDARMIEQLKTEVTRLNATNIESLHQLNVANEANQELLTNLTAQRVVNAEQGVVIKVLQQEINKQNQTLQQTFEQLDRVNAAKEELARQVHLMHTSNQQLVAEITGLRTANQRLVAEITGPRTANQRLVAEITGPRTAHEQSAACAVEPEKIFSPGAPCKTWIERVYDATGLTSLFGGDSKLPVCQAFPDRIYDALFGSPQLGSK